MSLVDVANKTDYNTKTLTKDVSFSVTSFFYRNSPTDRCKKTFCNTVYPA